MTPNEVKVVVGDTPGMGLEQGRAISAFIHAKNPATVLELGFYHGVSSCYIAAALAEIGAGPLVTIDNESTLTRKAVHRGSIGTVRARFTCAVLVRAHKLYLAPDAVS
jgi:predicted O-methyltransferase YrrM